MKIGKHSHLGSNSTVEFEEFFTPKNQPAYCRVEGLPRYTSISSHRSLPEVLRIWEIHWNPSIVDPSTVENPSIIDNLGLTNCFFTELISRKPLYSRRFALTKKSTIEGFQCNDSFRWVTRHRQLQKSQQKKMFLVTISACTHRMSRLLKDKVDNHPNFKMVMEPSCININFVYTPPSLQKIKGTRC